MASNTIDNSSTPMAAKSATPTTPATPATSATPATPTGFAATAARIAEAKLAKLHEQTAAARAERDAERLERIKREKKLGEQYAKYILTLAVGVEAANALFSYEFDPVAANTDDPDAPHFYRDNSADKKEDEPLEITLRVCDSDAECPGALISFKVDPDCLIAKAMNKGFGYTNIARFRKPGRRDKDTGKLLDTPEDTHFSGFGTDKDGDLSLEDPSKGGLPIVRLVEGLKPPRGAHKNAHAPSAKLQAYRKFLNSHYAPIDMIRTCLKYLSVNVYVNSYHDHGPLSVIEAVWDHKSYQAKLDKAAKRRAKHSP